MPPMVAPPPASFASPRPTDAISQSGLQRPAAPEGELCAARGSRDGGTIAMVPCPLCGSANQSGLRFCVTCGHLLTSASPGGPAAPAAIISHLALPRRQQTFRTRFRSPRPASRRRRPPPPPLATPATPLSPRLRWPRLRLSRPFASSTWASRPRSVRGVSTLPRRFVQGAQFCRFCSASLADAQSVPLQPSPNPIAAAPAPRGPGRTCRACAGAVAPPMASPAAVASVSRARLVLIARDGGEGPSYPLGESVDIGRTEGNIVIAEDKYISPRHARVALRGGAYHLRDQESTNGIFVGSVCPRRRPNGGGGGGGGSAGPSADSRSRCWPIKTCSWWDNRC